MQKGMMVVGDADITSRCRCRNKPGEYMLLPRANRVEHILPQFNGVEAQVLATPQVGAQFVEHELLIQLNGGTAGHISEDYEHFFYVLEGNLEFELDGKPHKMVEGGFSWLPPQYSYQFVNKGETLSRVVWIRRRYERVEGLAIPDPIIANERDVVAEAVDTYMEQHLTPYEDPAFDMGINLQVFDPGVYFSFVESHVMEHGLYMLSGRGVYWLNGDYMEVQKDDFIYMAPWCPQFFYATGWDKSAYLLYKDVNRDYVGYLD
jgi:(S)-ureidoglycine aminohydrolase